MARKPITKEDADDNKLIVEPVASAPEEEEEIIAEPVLKQLDDAVSRHIAATRKQASHL